MINVNDNIKMAYSSSTKQIDRIILNSVPYYITNVEYSDNCYQNGNVFGTAEAKQLQFEIENSINLEGQEYEYQTGIVINNEVNWISLGKFITYDVEEDDTTGITKVNAMDYMIKSNVLYDHSLDYNLGYTIKEILEDALDQCGLELGTDSFVNDDFVVYSDQFEDNALIRQVIIACAEISGTFAKIKNDNKLYLINLNKLSYGDLVTEEEIELKTEKGNKLILLEKRIDNESGVADSDTFFDLRDYINTNLKRNTHEINTLVLGMSNIEGENVVMQDPEMIEEDGQENKIVINDNPFAYTQELRSQLIGPIFNSIKGFAYTAYELSYQGLPYLECGDSVIIKTIEGSSIESYVFRYTFKSPNGLDSSLQAPSLTDAEVKYENLEPIDTRLKRTEIIVDKENQQIQSIVSEIGDRSQKTTTITQDIDGINSSVGIVADLTNVVSGTDPIQLTNCMEGELVELDIYGDNVTFNHLYPATDLYPSTTLYPNGSSKIKIYGRNLVQDAVEVQNDHWHNSLMPGTSANSIHTEIYYDSTYTKDWSSTYIELKPNTGYVYVNINAGSNYRGAIFNDFPFTTNYTSTNKISSVQYIGDYTYDWGVSSWISRVNEYTYFKTGAEGSWYLVMNGSFGTTGVYEVVDSIFEELDTKIQDSKFALQPTRRIVTTNSYKSLTVKIPKGIKVIKVTKQPSRRFGLATFKYYPNATNYATNYISNDDYGADVTEYEISVGNDDTYLVVYYYDSDIDNENPTTIKNSIKIYGAYGNYRIVDLQIDEVLRRSGDYRDKVVITNGKELLYRYITIVNGEIVIVENPTPVEVQDVSIDLVEGINYIEVLDYSTYISAKYVQKNEFTKIFATTYEVSSQIQQLANQLNFKVSRGNIISEINMGIDEQNGDIDSYLYMKSNKFKIESDYFNVALDGTIEATEGKIANFNMWRGQANYTTDSGTQATTEASFLTKYCLTNNQGYMSGMIIPDVMQARQFDFIFARSKGNRRESFFVKRRYFT